MIGQASAPASSANLGPGFDIVAVALGLHCTATAEPAATMTLTEDQSTRRLPEADLVARSVMAAVGQPMHVTLTNDVPRARGLGSSAAVVASVAAAAMKALGRNGHRSDVFSIVKDLEGHADNAAATVFGGLVAVADEGVQKLDLHGDLRVVVGIPDKPLPTHEARAALPASVSRAVAVRSMQRLAFLIAGLATGNKQTLDHAAGDELHEEPRAHLSPITGELIAAARKGGAVHACWSGAGPTALAFVPSNATGRVIGSMSGVLGDRGDVLTLPVDRRGLV
jgi:homoserine kinase